VAGDEAVIIDALRHTAPYLAVLERSGARVAAVIDTHAHADHISGGRALASRTGAPYYLHPYDAIHPMDMLPATFEFDFLHERRCIAFGNSTLDLLHVPGHPLGAVALLLDERFLFAGDTLFLDAIARPDLGGKAEAWTPLHHASLRRLLALGGGITVMPGHFSSASEADPRGAFVYGAHGKPALAPPQASSGLRFNLSHAAGRGLIGWAHGREIGVDVELVRPVRFGAKIARRYFSDDEQGAFAGVSGAAWDETFFRCWTRKEAFIKAVGDGLAHPLRSFSVPMSPVVTDESVLVHGDEAASKRWRIASIDAGPGFLGAIVTEREGARASS
jgi:glyoxylase-like metal-dependent hydrolase (beta-lactamase superfamily II)